MRFPLDFLVSRLTIYVHISPFHRKLFVMLAAKSAMFAKSLLSRPAAFQVPSQRVLSTAANLKVDGNQDKQVDSTIYTHV